MSMNDTLVNKSDDAIRALFRVAKTRAYAFFRHPRDMIALRHEFERRGL